MPIRIYDTKTRDRRDFVPVREGHAGMYLCGMTVQDRPHVGHMRSAIAGDIIRRYLEHRGYEVTFVYNFTDVDDKIIARGADEGLEYTDISKRNIDAFFAASDALNIKRATHYPRATDHIEDMHALIQTLVDKDLAYAAGGDVYFRVARFAAYGKLSGRKIAELKSGARIEVGEHKEDPLDFTLWKGAKPGEPAWDSPWGPGRPGWHIECSAMAKRYLGETFDIHAGGLDLVFPHHENEIAQSEGASGQPFANYWIHNGMVNLSGEKMSKSTRHFFLAEDILAEVDAMAVRFYLASTHYRSPIEFSRDAVNEAGQGYQRLVRAVHEAEALDVEPAPDVPAAIATFSEAFHGAMDDDFNSAKALGSLFEMAREVNRLVETEPAQARRGARVVAELAGVLGLTLEAADADVSVPADVQTLFDARQAARKAKDFAEADRLRDEILAKGFVIEDRPDGSRLART